MPEETVTIANRDYQVACEPGEERFLQNAARLLDAETAGVTSRLGRLPENRVLLMAGLMLADRSVGVEEQVRAKDERIAELERELAALRAAGPGDMPSDLVDSLAALAAQAETMAEAVEERASRP